jgi:hypothetical protein
MWCDLTNVWEARSEGLEQELKEKSKEVYLW